LSRADLPGLIGLVLIVGPLFALLAR